MLESTLGPLKKKYMKIGLREEKKISSSIDEQSAEAKEKRGREDLEKNIRIGLRKVQMNCQLKLDYREKGKTVLKQQVDDSSVRS